MTHRQTLLAALLAAALTTPALANPDHHPPDTTTPPGAAPMGMGGGMMGAEAMGGMHESMMGHMRGGLMGSIQGGMMRQMHEMMAQMHGMPVGQAPGMMHGAAGMSDLGGLAGEEFEVAFMSMMIAHHQGAIAMADWVLERGNDSEVLAAARAVKAAQAPEIEQMTTWLREWYDADIDSASAATMDADMSGMMTAMAEGPDPDAAFLTEMIAHHQGAIDMAQLALERATHAELRDLARDVIVTQAGEVHQYQAWLDESAD